jgi:UDP-GlcNAc:undecaprenyl-phosphate GlcNAc-1-phosphate transferase
MFLVFALYALINAALLYCWKNHGIYDVPSYRSNHKNITPTGAGVCFSIVFCCSEIFSWFLEGFLSVDRQLFLCGFAMLTAMGFIDDWKEVNYKTRLIVHILAVGMLLSTYQFDLMHCFLLAFVGVSLINACNFLDGINGFLSSQWLLTIGFLLAAFFSITTNLWILWIGVLVFLFFNFPKANLFMGDTGSTVLGYAYFYVILQMITINQNMFPAMFFANDILILFCLFPMAFAWFDIAATLLDRFLSKRSIVASYKDYGFHRLESFLNSHALTTIIYLLGNALLAGLDYYAFSKHTQIVSIVFGYFVLQLIVAYIMFFKLKLRVG